MKNNCPMCRIYYNQKKFYKILQCKYCKKNNYQYKIYYLFIDNYF